MYCHFTYCITGLGCSGQEAGHPPECNMGYDCAGLSDRPASAALGGDLLCPGQHIVCRAQPQL